MAMKYIDIDKIPIYFKIPITTYYSGELSAFQRANLLHVVPGSEFCEKDKFGDDVCCWYVSTVFGVSDDKQWLLNEIAELGCIPTVEEFRNGLFKEIKL